VALQNEDLNFDSRVMLKKRCYDLPTLYQQNVWYAILLTSEW